MSNDLSVIDKAAKLKSSHLHSFLHCHNKMGYPWEVELTEWIVDGKLTPVWRVVLWALAEGDYGVYSVLFSLDGQFIRPNRLY